MPARYSNNILSSSNIDSLKCWDLVKVLGWGSKTYDYNLLKQEILKLLTCKELMDFDNELSQVRDYLYNYLFDYVHEVSDDSYEDLIWHIIGLGLKEVQKVISNPQLANLRAQKGNFKESFHYSIPWIDHDGHCFGCDCDK